MKELLLKLGEETIYTAKGHFKACDIRRIETTITLWGCAIINILCLLFRNGTLCTCLSAISLFGMIALLIWDSSSNKDYRQLHKNIAEKYLSLHKEIRDLYFLGNTSQEQIEQISRKVRELDCSDKLEIPCLARHCAKRAIEKKDSEIDNWFRK